MRGNDSACSPEHRALRPCLGATTRSAGDEAEQAAEQAADQAVGQAVDLGASPGHHRRCEPNRPGRDETSGVGSQGPGFLWYGR